RPSHQHRQMMAAPGQIPVPGPLVPARQQILRVPNGFVEGGELQLAAAGHHLHFACCRSEMLPPNLGASVAEHPSSAAGGAPMSYEPRKAYTPPQSAAAPGSACIAVSVLVAMYDHKDSPRISPYPLASSVAMSVKKESYCVCRS